MREEGEKTGGDGGSINNGVWYDNSLVNYHCDKIFEKNNSLSHLLTKISSFIIYLSP